jgi:hypothetical protein
MSYNTHFWKWIGGICFSNGHYSTIHAVMMEYAKLSHHVKWETTRLLWLNSRLHELHMKYAADRKILDIAYGSNTIPERCGEYSWLQFIPLLNEAWISHTFDACVLWMLTIHLSQPLPDGTRNGWSIFSIYWRIIDSFYYPNIPRYSEMLLDPEFQSFHDRRRMIRWYMDSLFSTSGIHQVRDIFYARLATTLWLNSERMLLFSFLFCFPDEFKEICKNNGSQT